MLGLCGSCGGPPHPRVTLRLETGERIVLELYPEKAPNTANNFLCLADSGFYTGKVFSRSLGGYLIACDSRDAQGAQADIGYRIPGEFSQAGFAQNDLAHEAGVVTMARENARYGYPPEDSYDTAGSGFMILSAASPRMDGLYAAFGRVISGMDAVDKIAAGPTVGEQLAKPVEIRSAEVNYRGYQPQAPVKAEPWGKRGVIKLGAGGTGCTKAAAPSTGISSN
jgi:peptidyl-prolyl cis-trans isomerase B (cyclophilin B)